MLTAGSFLKLGAAPAMKAGGLIFQKIKRLAKIDDALRGIEKDDLAEGFITDFEIVKGTWRGEFDVPVDKFLRAFETGGLSQALFNEVIIGTRSPSLKKAFEALFIAETGQSKENADLLYQQVTKSFEISSACLSRDPVVARMLKSSHAALQASITSVESAIENIVSGIVGRPTDEAIAEILPRILRSVTGDTRYIRVETSQGRKEVEISKIYISPRLRYRNLDRVRPSIKTAIDGLVKKRHDDAEFSASVSDEMRTITRKISSIGLEDVSVLPRVVVLGNPGGGKSTILQSICHKLASDASKSLSDGASVCSVKVPIRIILRDFEHARTVSPQLNLIDYIVNDLLNSAYSDKNVLTSCVENMLATGQAYLAFDGLDEILKTANRRQFVDLVNRFVRQYPLCQVLVTSREVGYDNAPLSNDEYEELILGDFEDSDVQSYAERFIRFVGRKKVGDARQSAAHFMTQTSRNAADLRRNPLMLGLMMWIFNIRDDVPSNRPEIYEECARLMFERWDGERGILVDVPQTFDRLQVFCFLASRIFDDDDLSSGVSLRWIEREVKSHLCEVLESAPQAQAATTSLVRFISDRSWVMSEKGEGVFSFTHQTFLEYFFAKFNDQQFDTAQELVEFLLPHIIINEWDVVSRLSLQIKSHRNRRRQDEAMALLIEALAKNDLNDGHRRAIAGFGVRCLEFLIGSEANVRTFVHAILNTAAVCYKSGVIDVMEFIPGMFYGAQERRAFVNEAIEQWLIGKFTNGTDEDKDFVLACIDGISGKFQQLGSELKICHSIPAVNLKRFRGSLMSVLLPECDKDPRSCKTLFEWTGTLPKAAVNTFGTTFIYYSRPPLRINLDGLSALVLSASGKYANFFDESPLTRTKCETSLTMLGAFWRKTGIDGLTPFPKIEDLNNPPTEIWSRMLRGMRGHPDLRLASCIASFLTLHNHGRFPNEKADIHGLIKEIERHKRSIARSGDNEGAEILSRICDISKEFSDKIVFVEPAETA